VRGAENVNETQERNSERQCKTRNEIPSRNSRNPEKERRCRKRRENETRSVRDQKCGEERECKTQAAGRKRRKRGSRCKKRNGRNSSRQAVQVTCRNPELLPSPERVQ